MILYHLTPVKNLESILQNGLIPQIGPRSEHVGEKQAAVFCYPEEDYVEGALEGWIKDYFPNDLKFAIIEINLPKKIKLEVENDFEVACFEHISPKYIVACYDIEWNKI